MARKKDILFGRQPVLEALGGDASLEKVMLRKGAGGPAIDDIKARCRERGVPYQTVPNDALNRVLNSVYHGQRVNHQGIVAFWSAIRYHDLDDIHHQVLERGEHPAYVLLDGVTDVRNVGAIARSALGLGAHALIVPFHGSARIHADAVKTSAGALHRLPVCRFPTTRDAVDFLTLRGVRIVVADGGGSELVRSLDLTLPVCLVLGDEGRGVSPEVLDIADDVVRLPMAGELESYNVSVSCAMALYELHRQRTA